MLATRPALLQPLFAPLTSLAGIGEKNLKLLTKLLNNKNIESAESDSPGRVPRLLDLLYFLPHSVIDRRSGGMIMNIPPQTIATLAVRIERHIPPPHNRKKAPYKIIVSDESGEMELVFFQHHGAWLQKQNPVGEQRLISGKVEYFGNKPAMIHPDYMVTLENKSDIPLLQPVYPLTAGLSGKLVAKAVRQALQHLPPLPEWLDGDLIRQEGFPSYEQALRCLHTPQQPQDILPENAARRRLAYDEFLAEQIALCLIRRQAKRGVGVSLPQKNRYVQKIRAALPFKLTVGQERCSAEISQDLADKQRMLRLLQGDVGSGKTVLALLAMAQTAESDKQTALMAPTEILARQHYAALAPLAEQAGLHTILLTGREKGRTRAALLEKIASGAAHFIIGTHALLQHDVHYHDLALVIIDEQHRFGVEQRLQLSAKGNGVNVLVMTATPIPRSLVLAHHGDMDLSVLREKPPGRKPVTTSLLSMAKIETLLRSVEQSLAHGDKIYWICPLITESEKSDLTATEERFAHLRSIFGSKVGLIHGKLSPAEKDAAMAAFKTGSTQILVATTVVEVGMDIHDACIMIIEHAERFGLAQLHQLRGRVGRGNKASFCTLLYKAPLSAQARARLLIMRETEDGFRLAEEDLHLRGEGDILGLRQSGHAQFFFADLRLHQELLERAAKQARLLTNEETVWEGERGEALRLLLCLFRQNNALRLLQSG